MSNINPKTEELVDKLDALYEQEHEARINECPAYAASCRKEIRKIERQLRKAAAAAVVLLAGCGNVGGTLYTPTIWNAKDPSVDAAAQRILTLGHEQIGGRSDRNGSWAVAVTSGMQHQIKRLLLTPYMRESHSCESLADMERFTASASTSFDWVEWRKDYERTNSIRIGFYCGLFDHTLEINEDGYVSLHWREEEVANPVYADTPKHAADVYAKVLADGSLLSGTADEDVFRRVYRGIHEAPLLPELYRGFPVKDFSGIQPLLDELLDLPVALPPCSRSERHSFRVGVFNMHDSNSHPAYVVAYTCAGQPAEMRHQMEMLPADLGGGRFDYLLHVWTRGMVVAPKGASGPLK